ncbi:MAG: hypothetical protein V4592_21305 [Bacteroidota bacterium]
MKALIIFVVIIVILIVIKACTTGDQQMKDTSRPPADKKPIKTKENDKLILVENISHDNIKKALTMFCNAYNKQDYAAQPRLYTLDSNKFAVVFPYDVDFQTFCFAVNFLKYPVGITPAPMVIAWATAKQGDEWITEKSVNKKVMLYLAADDKEYDNVFLTTQDNIGYKLGFAMGQEKKLLTAPKENYISQSVDPHSLTNLKHEDFE